MKLDLGTDAWGSYRQVLHTNGDEFQVSFHGDNTARMEANKRRRNDGSNGFNKARDLRCIIELDMASIMLISRIHGVRPLSKEFDDLVLNLAQSSDWKNIKVVEGNTRTRMG